jgi:hypothetical protein
MREPTPAISDPKTADPQPSNDLPQKDRLPHPLVLGCTVAAMLLGIFAAFFGVLAWWVGVGVVGAAASFAGIAWKTDRLPLRASQLIMLSASSVLLAFAAKGIGSTLQSVPASYAFRVVGGYRIPAYFEPLQNAETTDAYSLGDEVRVRCRYVSPRGQVWYSVMGSLNDINNPWLPAVDVVPDLPSHGGQPPRC